MTSDIVIKLLGRVDYLETWQQMKQFTANRSDDTKDELWLLEHDPLFTQGQAGKAEHILSAGNIPVYPVDRGGQVTYHGPGQLVAYTLVDLKRRNIGVRSFVTLLEQAVINMLAREDIHAVRKKDAPGVYVDDAKVAALGLRVKKNCTYHGLAINIDMDLSPYERINPCGYANMAVTSFKKLGSKISFDTAQNIFTDEFLNLIQAHVG